MSLTNALHDLLASMAPVIGPDAQGPITAGQPLLSEWIAVLCWVDADGDSFLTRIGSDNLLAHHADGLLHSGLYGFGGDEE